jgi:hypothetical protein
MIDRRTIFSIIDRLPLAAVSVIFIEKIWQTPERP